ncbi:PP2C family protein-serine/threonine phosphatase [Streptomyces sp. NPDC020681]|uniref:PP2C family protein-serine/threonine phosphatase n=1 Tax=Streptomyces sp. NPDC020681 TaxID=3365083 RepID=UPI0037AAD7CE
MRADSPDGNPDAFSRDAATWDAASRDEPLEDDPPQGASGGVSEDSAEATSSAAGLAVLGTDTKYLYADPVYCRVSGETRAGLDGRTVSSRAELSVGPAPLLAAVLADGNSRTHVTPVSRCTWQRLTLHGEVIGLVGLLVETLTDAERHHISDAVDRIGTTLDEKTTCLEVVSFLHSQLADAAAIDLLPEEPPAFGGPAVERAAVAGHGELLPTHLPDAVLRGRPALDEQRLSLPLTLHDRVLGAVSVARARGGFGARDVLIAQAVARRAAVAVEHARMLGQAQRTAVELQRALLTDPGRPHPNLQLATRYLPSGAGTLVGGDWFETVRLHFGRTLLVMGDVMGHGVDAAVDMNSYRSALRDVAAADLPPHRVLRLLDQDISDSSFRRPATCLLVRVDPARDLAAFSSAGHLPPAVFSREGAAELVRVPVGPPLGTGLGGYDIISRTLNPGDTLLMFTDGLVERRGEDIDASLARLAQVRPDPGGTLDDLVETVLNELDAAHAEDDVALMAVRIRGKEAPGEE